MLVAVDVAERFVDDYEFDIVERKGVGHPDSLADGLAEELSRAYSQLCLDEFGVILHHNTDKTALLGGAATVAFGGGRIDRPVTALVNGRFSQRLGQTSLPVEELVLETSTRFLCDRLPLLSPDCIEVRTRLSSASSPGAVASGDPCRLGARSRWFNPESVADLSERHRLHANDTSAGVGYAPLSLAERAALAIEGMLNEPAFKATAPEFGTDIKVMVCRSGGDLEVTLCVPQIDLYTANLAAYIERKHELQQRVRRLGMELAPSGRATVAMNTRDDHDARELYLTVIGSSIESGDEGVVGRGNRCNGVISVMRPMSLEGASGKNPVYHVGKLYNLLAQAAADQLFERFGRPVSVCLVSRSGGELSCPAFVGVQQVGGKPIPAPCVAQLVEDVMASLPTIQDDLLAGRRSLC
ncbi:MAG: methionine adenosyltransferase [bacterium]|nr:methionine adenosyltransferase [bacterium]